MHVLNAHQKGVLQKFDSSPFKLLVAQQGGGRVAPLAHAASPATCAS